MIYYFLQKLAFSRKAPDGGFREEEVFVAGEVRSDSRVAGTLPEKELLGVEEVAGYLGVGEVTIYRWCRDGSLPCMKLGKAWRIRREGLVEFLESRERPATLTGRLRSFLEVPDNVIAVAQRPELMYRLDAAFFRVGEAHGGLLIKYHAGDGSGGISGGDLERLRDELEAHDLSARSLEDEGRMRFLADADVPKHRPDELRRLLEDEARQAIGNGRSVWVAFNWEERVDLKAALEQQRALTELVGDSRLVVKTSVLERIADEWMTATWREAQAAHSGAIWLSEGGLTSSRVSPVPED